MSDWSHITGVIHLDSNVTEDSLLSIYGLYSHNFVGSEGGLNISFTRTLKKDCYSSSESDYYVEPYTRISNMVLQGDLRDFDFNKLENAKDTLVELLERLNERIGIRNASFVLENDCHNAHYQISFINGESHTQEITT